MKLTRREILLLGLSASASYLFGCNRHSYVRQKEQANIELDLGTVKSLLFNQVHIPVKSVLVFRDLDGWRALSTRCSFEGCDLTVHDQQSLFCACCKSEYDIKGVPFADSKAKDKLPWLEIFYKEGHLYARAGKVVSPDYKFTDPKIEEAVKKLKLQVREEKIEDGAKIPSELLGSKDADEEGMMFLDKPPEVVEP